MRDERGERRWKVTVEFEYAIGDRVKILDIGMLGAVVALCQDVEGQQYRVVYWNNGERFSVWMYSWELTKS